MSAHTPAPWSVPHFAQPDVDCQCRYVLHDEHMGAICTVHTSGEGEDWQANGDHPKFAQACANARLIAAAPDLLEALEEVARCAIANSYDADKVSAQDNEARFDKIADIARAAIAKATQP